jgi:hypothetical protein
MLGGALEPFQNRRAAGVEDETLHVFFSRRRHARSRLAPKRARQ